MGSASMTVFSFLFLKSTQNLGLLSLLGIRIAVEAQAKQVGSVTPTINVSLMSYFITFTFTNVSAEWEVHWSHLGFKNKLSKRTGISCVPPDDIPGLASAQSLNLPKWSM